jgi:phosphoribosyl-dephospho-CoA transferase
MNANESFDNVLELMLDEHALPLVHDLLRLRTPELTAACVSEPSWVNASLERSSWVVVRRALAPKGLVAIGVRGEGRHQRWGAFISLEQIAERATPCDLRTRTMSDRIASLPAVQSLRYLETQFSQLALEWGPGGSIGYEIASGVSSATHDSDLDLIIRASERVDLALARDILATIRTVPARVDPRIETPYCGFSLQEYCDNKNRKILVRTPTGCALSDDPWRPVDRDAR